MVDTVRTYCRNLLAAVVVSATVCIGAPQEAPPKHPSQTGHTDAFFSGTVVELSSEKVTVSRTVLGKPAEKRTFLLTGDTKVEGKLAPKTRVTVRYMTGDQGDVALSILVRDKADKDKRK